MSRRNPPLNRREFLRLGAAGVLAAGNLLAQDRASTANTKPNFVIFYTDDQGIGDIGCYGATDIQTPHMDALAASGVRFTDWYSASPVCSPSRAALLTGRYPQRTGVSRILKARRGTPGLYADEVTIAKALKKLGYRTGAFGKWHLGSAPQSRPNSQGFDEFYGFHAGCIDYYSHIMYWEMGSGIYPVHDLWKNDEEVWENGTYFTDIITRESIRFIRQNSSRPFFLYVPYNAPHYPMHAPRKYFERYKHLEPHRRLQAAMVATVDESIGKIMGVLKEESLLENTVVFFQSDNGATIEKRCLLDDSGEPYHGGSNHPFRGYKGGLYEGGIRMPAMLSWPGHIPAGTVCKEMGCAIDILPTFLGIAGAELPERRIIDGKDILPMAKGEAASPHQRLFWAYGNQLAVREGRWKLILQPEGSFEKSRNAPEAFLADLENDPGEKINLAAQKPELTQRLKESALKWKEDVSTNR